MVSGVIFGVEYLILATKSKVLGEMAFCGVNVWRVWGSDGALMGPPMFGNGRYANPR